MQFVEVEKKKNILNSNERIISNLFKAYENVGYSPEYYDDSTILIKTPVEFIVSFIDNKVPVSLNKLHRLWTPLKEVSEFTGIKNYILISKHGFEEECYSVEGYAVRLETMDYVKTLLNSSLDNKPLELMPHNHLAFKKLMTMWESERFASIVHATGTGKSFIISKVLQTYTKGNVILACPTVYILEQFKELFSKLGILSDRIDFVTYTKLALMNDDELDSSKYDFIILDELHRTGADRWGAGVKRIIDNNKGAKVLGLTATPIRYLDDRRDMTEELFEGNVASSLDLFEAIGRGILPVPKYVEALYDVSNDLSSLESSIMRSTSSSIDKEILLEDIRKFKISWDAVHSVKNIISKHFTPEVGKVIVFCKNIAHLKEMKPLVKDWFTLSEVYKDVNIFEAYSSSEESKDELDLFKEPINKGTVNILLSVDKINEGVHIDGVDSVIFLRNSLSQNIVLQQIGRALSATSNSTPIILDLINNIEVLGSQSFYNGLNSAIDKFNDTRDKLTLIQDAVPHVNFDVLDETKDFISFMEKTLSKILKTWDDFLKDAVECKERTGWFPGPNTPNEDAELIKWVARQRNLNTNNKLSENRLAKLNEVNFVFSFNKEKWLYMYERLLSYKFHNKVDDFFRHKIEDTEVNVWVQKQRRRYQLNQIEEEEYNLLIDAGVSFNLNDDLWEYYINRLKEFYSVNGFRNPTEKEDNELCIFSRVQRKKKIDGILDEDKEKLLNSINFVWSQSDTSIKFPERVLQLKEYINIHGDTKVPSRYKGFNNLGQWVRVMRAKKRRNILSKDKVDVLESLNFCWEPDEDNFNCQVNEIVEFTKAKLADSSVIASKPLSESMLRMRNKYFKGELSEDVVKKLEDVGFIWNPVEDTWNKRISQLKEYYSLYNTFKISNRTDFPDTAALRTWLNRQVSIYKKGTYPAEKQKELESIGFDFNKKYTFNKK